MNREIVVGRLPRGDRWRGQRHVSLRRFVLELYPAGTWEKIRAGEARVEVDGITLEEINSQIPIAAEVVVYSRREGDGSLEAAKGWRRIPGRIAEAVAHPVVSLRQVFPFRRTHRRPR